MRLSILWARLAGYTVSFFRRLAEQEGISLQLSYAVPGGHLEFDGFDVTFCTDAFDTQAFDIDVARRRLHAFRPDALLLPGWNLRPYLQLAREFRRRGTPVISAMDVPWRGTLRQRVGCLVAPWLLHPCIDSLYVPGERQEAFGRRLGFRDIHHGLYCADVDHFLEDVPLETRPANFLFIGRLVERKGVDVLLQAYARYRAAVSDPMGLLIAGSGPFADACRNAKGVRLEGFVQPAALPRFFRQGQCLVLPSREENWGVVLHEGAAAGLPLIATRECAGTVTFLPDGSNGYAIAQGVDPLYEALLAFHKLSPERRNQYSRNSRQLGLSWTPELQARHFRGVLEQLVARHRRPAVAGETSQ